MIAVIIWFFVGRLVKKGLFGDGLLYASMSRNMAEGRGDMWHPFFSSSYWIEGLPQYYYENPPLMIWLQSLFFNIHGDHWWVEKWFCFWVLVFNVLAIKYLWSLVAKRLDLNLAHWPVVVLCWYLIPISIWGNANNMMDNLLLTWCLLAVAFSLKGHLDNQWQYLVLAGMMIFLGFLTKGPVALYALAVPGLLWLIRVDGSFVDVLKNTSLVLFAAIFLFGLLIYLIPDAKDYFQFYWEQRLKAVIVGSRGDDAVIGWARIFTLKMIVLHSLGLMAVASVTYFIRKNSNIVHHHRPWIVFFVILGIASTLPIMISTKQSEIYLIPGLPMLAFALGIYLSPLVSKYEIVIRRRIVIQMLLLTIMIGIVSAFINFGTYRREADLVKDIEKLTSSIGSGHKIGVDSATMANFVYHTYMQRMGKYELTKVENFPKYLILQAKTKISFESAIQKYDRLPLDTKSWEVWQKKETLK